MLICVVCSVVDVLSLNVVFVFAEYEEWLWGGRDAGYRVVRPWSSSMAASYFSAGIRLEGSPCSLLMLSIWPAVLALAFHCDAQTRLRKQRWPLALRQRGKRRVAWTCKWNINHKEGMPVGVVRRRRCCGAASKATWPFHIRLLPTYLTVT